MNPVWLNRAPAIFAHYRFQAVALALIFTMVPLESAADIALPADEAAEEEIILDELVVTATRTRAEANNLPVTVTSIDSRMLGRIMPYDEAAMFKNEPDIAMSRDLRRFGSTRINIRGIEDNRVTQLVDGIRLPDYYFGSGPANFTMNAPLGTSIAFLRQVEVLRGPASSLYGSDAIGGVVGYITLNPSDLIAPERNSAARYSVGYNGVNSSWSNTLIGAFQGESAEFLLGYTRTEGHAADNQGRAGGTSKFRSEPNPQDFKDQGALAKLILQPSERHRLSLAVEGREREMNVDLKRLSASPTLQKVTQMAGDDRSHRTRASIEWEYWPENAYFNRLLTRFYHQDSQTHNFNQQTRSNTSSTCSAALGSGSTCHVEQDFHFDQKSVGGGVQFESEAQWWSKSHQITYGIDVSRLETEELRDATRWNLTTGMTSKSLAGDNYPLRDFAIGRTDSVGIFIQDEISGWSSGQLTVTPGLRYDWRQLKPDVDVLAQQFLTANQREAVEQTDAAISPRIAALWQFDSYWSVYGQLARGFRAPNYEEVNSSFRNTVQSWGISPNPDLKPETSTSLEVGAKLRRQRLQGQIALYDNRYKNFIESVELDCPANPGCISGLSRTNMFVNLSRVRIYGAELRMAWDFLSGWKLDGAVAWAHGENESNGKPLNSIEPARASLGLLRDAGTWGMEARLRGAHEVTRTDDSSGDWYRPAGYVVTDLNAWWHFDKSSRLNIALNNLFDKKYWLWSDIRQADSRAPLGVSFYSQPGRSLSATLSYDF